MFGLTENDIDTIISVLASNENIESAKIFGSRAKGTYKPGSDVDISICGSKITYEDVIKVSTVLNEETCLPYRLDVLDFSSIKNDELLKHIIKYGVIIYKSATSA
jgi:predicted nucleotidyltransferase